MLVRNKKLKGIFGKWTEVADKDCANKTCFHPHDFGYRLPNGKWGYRYLCLTREKIGCPEKLSEIISLMSSSLDVRKKE